MKANKFWSILMLVVMAFATSVTISSCSDDAPAPGSQNTFTLDGKTYTIEAAGIMPESDGTYFVAIGNMSRQLGFEIEHIQGFGESVMCSEVEIEDGHDEYDGKARNVRITLLKNGNTYTVKFDNLTFTYGSKTYKGSLNYVGPMQTEK